MKKFNVLMVLALLVSAVSAEAGFPGFRPRPRPPVVNPDAAPQACWIESGRTGIDGAFTVSIDSASLSGAEVTQALSAITQASVDLSGSGRLNLIASQDGSSILVQLFTQKEPGESRADQIKRGNEAVSPLLDLPGVTVECVGNISAQGGISGSN